jgi:uncharacterized protein (DUF2345 family)
MTQQRPGVLQGDLVLCPCGENRVLASPNPGCFYEDDSDSADVGGAAQSVIAPDAGGQFDEQFVMRDADGTPIPDMRYTLHRANGAPESGTTDAHGHTHLLASVASQEDIHIYMGSAA